MTQIEDPGNRALLSSIELARERLDDIRRAARTDSGEGVLPALELLGSDLDQLAARASELPRSQEELVASYQDQKQILLRDVSAHRRSEADLRESHRFIAAILGALTSHVAVLDEKGDIIAVNTAWERFAHSERAGAPSIGLGTNYLAVLDAGAARGSEEDEQVAAAIREILAGRRSRFSIELPSRTSAKDRWFSLRLTPFEGRGAARVVVAKEDVTERRRAEEALRQSMNRTQAILDSAVDGILTIDETGILQSVNPAAERMFGYSVAELQGRSVNILMPSPDRERHDSYIASYLETGNKKIIGIGREVLGQRRDGTVFPLDLAVSEVYIGGKRTFMGTLRDVTERKEIEEALLRQRDFAESLVETAQVIVLVLDTRGRIVRFNRYFEEVSGYRLDEVRGQDWFGFLPPRDRDRIRKVFERGLRDVPTRGNVNQIVTRDGTVREIEWYSKTLREGDGEVLGVLATGHDITERLELEEQFRQAQKMEAIGRLAGGVAHDFNTLLGTILGYSEMLLDRLGGEDALRRPVEQIRRGAERGAALTRQLLAFSRRQVLRPEVLDLNAVLDEMDDMLGRLIGADLALEHRKEPELASVKVDAGQIQQVIMNLVVNACDALAEIRDGRIVIATENAEVDETQADRAGLASPGCYVRLSVRDTGCGMDERTRRRAFEPFFTTKEVGKGTGLGLSTVYGIVRQSGGGILVESESGGGTVFEVYLPRSGARLVRTADEDAVAPPRRGSETVLLVEDDEMFLELLGEVLEAGGYHVMAAAGPAEALVLSERHPGEVELLVSDMVMPGMSGKELAVRLSAQRPEMKVLLMSGYSDEALAERGVSSDSGFIQKPFSTKELVRKVRQRLDGDAAQEGDAVEDQVADR
ncbi:MAG: PAS domain S-box protein [bacterium]|nr:PAS domain S-box protein [bacterium]